MLTFYQKKNRPSVITALLTPFSSNGDVDFHAFERLLDFQIQAGVDGWVICGSTGEASTLTEIEKKKLIEFALQKRGSRPISVIAGTGTNCTRESIELSSWAANAGVDSVLCVTPYYNKPNQQGMIQHYLQIADAIMNTKCDLTLYNNPGRSAVGLTPQAIAELSLHSKIRNLKESSGRIEMFSEILVELNRQNARINLLSGDDASFLPALSLGAVGLISVASNIRPEFLVNIANSIEKNDWSNALSLHNQNFQFMKSLFLETNPVPAKYLMSRMENIKSTDMVRLPLLPLSKNQKDLVLTNANN